MPLYVRVVAIGSCPSLLRFEGTLHRSSLIIVNQKPVLTLLFLLIHLKTCSLKGDLTAVKPMSDFLTFKKANFTNLSV